MISKELKINDYVVSGNGILARVIRVNKTNYRVICITKYNSVEMSIRKDGCPSGSLCYYANCEEWFECENAQAEALKSVFERFDKYNELKALLDEAYPIYKKIECLSKELKDFFDKNEITDNLDYEDEENEMIEDMLNEEDFE